MIDCFYVGSSRTGSTWLYQQLRTHPEVYMPVEKPVRFWNRKLFGSADSRSSHPTLTLEQYQSIMKSVPGKKTLDMTDGYNVLGTVDIEHIKKLYPNAKILFTLRDPVELHISHILLHSNDVNTSLSEENVISRIKDQYSYYSLNAEQSKNIRRWSYWFGSDNVGCFFYDFMKTDQYQYIRQMSNFIGIDPTFWNNIEDLKKKINTRKTQRKPPKRIYDLLYNHYMPEIESLEKTLNVDLSAWKQRKTATDLNQIYHPASVLQ